MSPSPVSVPSDSFRAAFIDSAGPSAEMSFEDFMRLALYDPGVGYYRQQRTRVGLSDTSDFYTASTSGPVFGEAIAAACASLLSPNNVSDYTFVEIGPETAGGVLHNVSHTFAGVRTVKVGDPIELSGRCVVFSNELFDAQPFRRFVRRDGRWKELGVALRGSQLTEIESDLRNPCPQLPADAIEGYVIDAPIAAAALAREIAAQPWTGLFIACDYGKSWGEVTEACPAGTARAYYRHRQSNDLLARPGEQDLTCHICWDWLIEALGGHDFTNVQVEAQESFFVRRASDYIARVSTTDAAQFSARKVSLLQLLHPAHMGQKFQVLHGVRN